MTDKRYDCLYISPHLDDAVLSCGAQIADKINAGKSVLNVSLFTANEPDVPPSEFARKFHSWLGLDGNIVDARRKEDIESCRILKADHFHAGLSEALYRLDSANGKPYYNDVKELFDVPAQRDLQVLTEIEHVLKSLPTYSEIYIPLGVGGHVDHQLVRRAAENIFPSDGTYYYEDYPYVSKWGALRKILKPRRRWIPHHKPCSSESVNIKIQATAAHKSQIKMLFGSSDRMHRQILSFYKKRSNGERVWSRRV